MTYWIGLDPATKCGWAVLNEDGHRIASGVWKLGRRTHEGQGMLYVRFERLFGELLATYRPALVAFEQQANRFAGAAHVGLGLISHIERICEETGVPYSGVAFAAVKKHATGRGNAKKADVIDAALGRWGLTVETDDEADALFIADALREGLA